MIPSLTSGAIHRILSGEDVPKPIMQLLGYKKVPGTGTDRYRLLISDGAQFSPFAMLGTQLNHMVTNKELEKFTVIQVDKCVCNKMSAEKRVIILLNITVLVPGAQVGEKIGNPVAAAQVPNDAPAANVATCQREPTYNGTSSSTDTYANSTYTSSGTTSSLRSNTYAGGPQDEGMNVHPIASLTPYQNKWTIKARVTSKSTVRHWSNSRGEGKLFTLNFLDESGEIRATAFNDCVDKFFDVLQVNKVYYVSRATLKPANKNFSNVKNDYEMTFNGDTTVIPCEENTRGIPMLQFNFVPIPQIEQVEKDTNIDVIGVCKSASDVQTIITRNTNKEVAKRDVRLVDTSNTEVSLTLWGDEAVKFDPSSNPVVAVKGARVSDFNGRSLSVQMTSTMQINPDIKEAHILKGWFDREGCRTESQSISVRGASGSGGLGGAWKTFAQVTAENLGMGEKPDFYMNKATVVLVRKENCMYMACPSEDCNKKVIDMNNGTYRCEKCNKEYGNFKWRLLVSLSLADFTENTWVTCFQEAGEVILGIKADELGRLKETDEDKFNEVLSDANFKSYVFKLRTKMETFNEESRLKTVVVTATPVDPLVYGKKLLDDIKLMQKEL